MVPADRNISITGHFGAARARLCAMLAAVVITLVASLVHADFSLAMAQQARGAGEQSSGETAEAEPPRRVIIRFLTTSDFPPFNSLDEDGQLSGLNIDLARAICLDLAVTCDIRARPWDELIPAIERGEADAIIAGQAITKAHLAHLDFTLAYFNTPARFASLVGTKLTIGSNGLAGRKVGVARGTAHAAYLKDFFSRAEIVEFATPELVREALQRKELDAIFDDGVSLVFWVNGALSRTCCELSGGPYLNHAISGMVSPLR